MSYEEFIDTAEKLRPWTEQAMKIEVAPWIRDYVVDMDDLYCDLTLEKVENKPARQVNTRLKDYRELFRENEVNTKITDSMDDDSGSFASLPSVLTIDETIDEIEVNTRTIESMIEDSLDDVTEYESTPSVLTIDEDGPGVVKDSICTSLCSCFKSLQKKNDIPEQGNKSLANPFEFSVHKSNISHHSPICFELREKSIAEVAASVEASKNTLASQIPRKILIKGDPGMGKTTLCKKVAWDWAKKLFTTFSIVFFVFLKLVKPGDAVENVIVQQNPFMRGLGITEKRLKYILDTFGNKCLIILDGLDEHALGTNGDVLNILRGEKYFNCNVIVTSRPHITRTIETFFTTIARVNGFTHDKAKQFASKILSDNAKIAAVLTFNPTGFREEDKLHSCPILLSFMCLLVREDDIDLTNKAIHVGEIYTRMVRCLYKKFTIRKEILFGIGDFVKAMAEIGKLAFETLLSENPLLQRSYVINQAGEDAFDYGLLIGHEDAYRLIKDETADIFVTFPHRSLQEFLGAFYFVWMLDQGELLESLLGADRKPIFMTNPLFLQFCLWFCTDQDYFQFGKKDDVYRCLKVRCLESMRRSVLDTRQIAGEYPALDIKTAYNRDKLWLEFLGDILVNCDSSSILAVRNDDPLQWILSSMGPALKTVTCLTQGNHLSYFYGNDVIVHLGKVSWDEINMVVDHFTKFVDNPQIHLYLHEPRDLQDKICAERIKKMYIKCPQSIPNYSILLPLNPHLTHICIVNMSDSETMQGWLFHLSEATKSGALSCLSHLSFIKCNGMWGDLPKTIHINMA